MKRMVILTGALVLFAIVGYSQGKFSGYMFGDYYYNVTRDGNSLSNVASPAGGTSFQAFQFRRIYFTYDNTISQKFSARFRLEADQSANASNGAVGVMVKDASIKWSNIFTGSDFYFGIQPTPAFEVSENFWGYRSLEKTILDLRGIVSSRDIAMSLRGSILPNKVLSYWIMLGNGNGNKPENDKFKRMYLSLATQPMKGLTATAYVDYNARAKKMNPYNTISSVSNDLTTYALFAGYSQKDKFRVGGEVFMQSIAHEYNNGSSLVSKDAEGFSLFGTATILPSLEAVARYDYYDPNTASSAKGDKRMYFLAGLSYKADKNFSITPNVIYETYEKLPSGVTPKSALTLRATLYYIFL